LWPVRESRRKAGRTFATALLLLDEYPDYVFGASQPQQYEWIKEDYPELYSRIRTAVTGGRWEPQGAMWVEPDMNIPAGESFVRQLLFGKRFYKEEFNYEVTNLWLPDVFGYSAALPQILKLAGVDSFITQKISWNEMNTFPHHTFLWEGIDGTRIRTHFLPTNTYNAANSPDEMISAEKRFAQADITSDWLNLYGIGDGGGGPSRLHIEMARRGEDVEGSPRMHFGRADEFCRKLSDIRVDELPLWRGELYLELHRGTYTTQARMKRYNRLLELRIRDAEFLSAVAGNDQTAAMEPIWKDTLLNQFHDILPGSSIGLVYDEAHRQSEEHLQSLDRLTEESLGTLFGSAQSPAGYVVTNTLSWERHGLVVIPVGDSTKSVVSDSTGQALTTQAVQGGLLVPVTVPSMGYATITVSDSGSGDGDTRPEIAETPELSPQSESLRWAQTSISPVVATEKQLRNGLVTVTLGEDGTISSIYDQQLSREVLAGSANRFLLWEDLPYSWDAWDISHYYRETTPEQAVLEARELVESGPLRAVVYQKLRVGNSTIEQWLSLEAEAKMIQTRNTVEWHESHKQLRVEAVADLAAMAATYEIQFGAVSRPTHSNTSWDAAQFEVAGHRFADLSQPDYGLGIVNDCKYGHYIRDNIVDLTLIRSSTDPDPQADQGNHEFTFGYYPHASGWQESDLLERAHELNAPLLVYGAGSRPSPVQLSWFTLSPGTVNIDTVKRAEDGDGLILRLYETRGTTERTVLFIREEASAVDEVNLLEEQIRALPDVRSSGTDGFATEVELSFTPFQIRSFRVRL
jgi:alpha-mannosidase